MQHGRTVNVQEVVDRGPMSPIRVKAIVSIMLVSFFDGFDALVMAITAPSIAAEWGVTTASLTPAIVASLIGMIVGGVLVAPRADRYGRRLILISGVAVFGVMTLAVLLTHTIEQMVVMRFLAGIGLGAVLPNTYAYASEFAPTHRRATYITIAGASSAGGGFLGGLLASAIIPVYGWQAVFVLGGGLPALLVPALLLWMPETVQFLTNSGRHGQARSILRKLDPAVEIPQDAVLVMTDDAGGEKPTVRQLFTGGLLPVTLLLGVVFFNAVLLILFLMSWIPSVLTEAGFPESRAVAASAVSNLGAMIGGVAIGMVADRSAHPRRFLSACFGIAAVATVATAFTLGSYVLLMLSVFAVGAFAIGTQMAVNSVVASIYPSGMRATAMGTLSGIGRVGSVVGPSIGGALLAAQMPAQTIFLLAVIPAVVAGLALSSVGLCGASRRIPQSEPDGTDSGDRRASSALAAAGPLSPVGSGR